MLLNNASSFSRLSVLLSYSPHDKNLASEVEKIKFGSKYIVSFSLGL